MIWFTADTHFGHKNILEYTNRPFSSIEEMDETLIENWNSKVSSSDRVYHLGDVGLCSPNKLRKILERLNGNIYLIRGNHDKSAEACKERFEWIEDYYELTVQDSEESQGKQLIVLLHYAMRVWQASHYGTYHLYGHSHGQLPDDPTLLSFDVGVDCHNYTPINYDDVKRIMKAKNWKPPTLRGE
ncbi:MULTISPECIES: metallophosphoesterase family protein [Nostocales]|uniref:Phosphoesterase n=3 Tax=Nostocales TaxID=1161 RepID=A0A0C1R7U4_9CYAN|nr:metallophosphoesterase [Tolypothrix bouteillei]KAF3884334.1 phosphoesterase [Tolypothrix bouteillei VB521301]